MAAPPGLSEDDLYRSSTQYKYWSFTPSSLAAQRTTTNRLAAARVRDAIRRARHKAGTHDASTSEEVDCLTEEEELKIIRFYCEQTMALADFCELPSNIKATAVQYLKRFYLSNSPMTYHPKQMMHSALFLATKTDNHYMSLKSFAAKLNKATEESVIAPEFLLTQGLRFTFDVRHPHRGLEGGFMELQAMAMGKYEPRSKSGSTKQIQDQMLRVPAPGKDQATETSVSGMQARIQRAHQKASQLLKTSAILSDAYFLYTPSQIWLAALHVADKPLASFYIQCILAGAAEGLQTSISKTIQDCAAILDSHRYTGNPTPEEVADLRRIDKKLYKCQNPEKIDLVSINKAQKAGVKDENGESGEDRNGVSTETNAVTTASTPRGEEVKVVKKRKVGKDVDDMFGPSIAP